jgi:hypothetical protein
VLRKLETGNTKLETAFRGVSSTVKLSVSKTELGGSNPSAPARVYGPNGQHRRSRQSEKKEVKDGDHDGTKRTCHDGKVLAREDPELL